MTFDQYVIPDEHYWKATLLGLKGPNNRVYSNNPDSYPCIAIVATRWNKLACVNEIDTCFVYKHTVDAMLKQV